MKAQKLFELDSEQLKQKLYTLLQEQFKLRLQKSTGQLKQTHLLRQVRREIAKVKTVIQQRAGN